MQRSISKVLNARTFKTSASRASETADDTVKVAAQAPKEMLIAKKFPKSQSLPAKGAFFPETSRRSVGYWLLGSAASVFGIVVFGGLTRLTESGLAICLRHGGIEG